MNNKRIVLWRRGSEPELEYDPITHTMYYTEDHNTYEMKQDPNKRFTFQTGVPGYIRCQQSILNGVIFEHTNWLNLEEDVQQSTDSRAA